MRERQATSLTGACWRLDLGAEVQTQGVYFRVWAPEQLASMWYSKTAIRPPFALSREDGGYFSGATSTAGGRPLSIGRRRGPYPDPLLPLSTRACPWSLAGGRSRCLCWTDAPGVDCDRAAGDLRVNRRVHARRNIRRGSPGVARYLRDLGVTCSRSCRSRNVRGASELGL